MTSRNCLALEDDFRLWPISVSHIPGMAILGKLSSGIGQAHISSSRIGSSTVYAESIDRSLYAYNFFPV